ncbi:MAG TPA: copper resistance CopC family protein [Jatrophihabitantaceae bacterium]|nr:copper resistance CopC family protein [Jatrophihabitantaceae bacterium]
MGSRLVRRVVEFCAVLVIAAAAMVMTSPAALAHDHLVTASPRDGSQVTALPDDVVLTFEEPPVAGYTKVRVVDPRGELVSPSNPTTNGSIVTVALAHDAIAGTYHVVWSVLSDDGHPVSGVVTFTVATATTTKPAAVASGVAPRHGGTWIVAVVGGIAALVVVSAGGSFARRGRRAEHVSPNA